MLEEEAVLHINTIKVAEVRQVLEVLAEEVLDHLVKLLLELQTLVGAVAVVKGVVPQLMLEVLEVRVLYF